MNISILIPNHNDLRMHKMIKSIDYFNTHEHHVELVIVLNKPTFDLLNLVDVIKAEYKNKFEFKIIEIDKCNLGLAYNAGICNATYDNILFIDTDLICKPGAIKIVVESMNEDIDLVKAQVVYKNMNNFIEKARYINTTEVKPPYIPVILIKKSIFKKLQGDFLFAVDTVWCSDAEFANRVLASDCKIRYVKAEFIHDKITIKKDIKDAFVYGFGKAIRIKRTKEKWKPFKEISDMYKNGKRNKLGSIENAYSLLWISLQQLSCLIQRYLPVFFKESIPFEESTKVSEAEI